MTIRHSQLQAHLLEGVATLVATLRTLQDTAEAMMVQESLTVMKARVRQWDKREQQWDKEKGELEGSVAEAELPSKHLVLAKEDAERGSRLHELQGAQVQLKMDTLVAIKAREDKNWKLRSTNTTMPLFRSYRAAEQENARLQKEIALMKQAKGDPSGFVSLATPPDIMASRRTGCDKRSQNCLGDAPLKRRWNG